MTSEHVIVVGSINTDLVVTLDHLPAPGETVTGGRFERHGGGKGANQAVAAARAGARVTFIGAVGDDDLGTEAAGLLEAEGIDPSHVVRTPAAATGVALIVVDARGENQIAVASGANATLDAEAVARGFPSSAGPQAVCLSNLEIGDDAVLAAARLAAEAGMRFVLNPAPARALPDGLLDLHPVLTPNRSEVLGQPGARDPESAARALAKRSGAPVVVTLGAAGAMVVDDSGIGEVPAYRVDPVDTTGAGDAFNGVLAARMASGLSLRDALPFALAGAALSVTVAGAREGMPAMREIEQLVSSGSAPGL